MRRLNLSLLILLISLPCSASYKFNAGDNVELGTIALDFREEVETLIQETNDDLVPYLDFSLSCNIPPDPADNAPFPVYSPIEDKLDAIAESEEEALDVIWNLTENIQRLIEEKQDDILVFVTDRVGSDQSDPDFLAFKDTVNSNFISINKEFNTLMMQQRLYDLQSELIRDFVDSRTIELLDDTRDVQEMFQALIRLRREYGISCTVQLPCFHMPWWIIDEPSS